MTTNELPPEVTGPSAWTRADIEADESWRVYLTDDQTAEIEAAAAAWLATERDIAEMTAEDFPLPTVAPLIGEWNRELLNGRGFVVITGLPSYADDLAMAAAVFYGLGLVMGVPRSQNGKGHLLGHVCDLGLSTVDGDVRIYQTTERQNYHTDSCDVVGLMSLRKARSGGESGLVSSMTVFNEMRRRRPDLLRELTRFMYTDRRGEVTKDGLPYFRQPIFSWHEGYLSALYAPHYVRSAPRLEGVPDLTDAQHVALDLLDELADDPKLNVEFMLEPGELLFVHNHTIFHDRTAYEDWGPDEGRRHLLRLWLAIPGARPLPDWYAARFGATAVGDRGGIVVPGVKANVPVEPV